MLGTVLKTHIRRIKGIQEEIEPIGKNIEDDGIALKTWLSPDSQQKSSHITGINIHNNNTSTKNRETVQNFV